MYEFDYENKVWGSVVPTESPFCLAGLRFHYFLKAISGKTGKLLEIGCGAGGNLAGISKYRPYLNLYGVDIGTQAIEYGRTKFRKLNLNVGSATSLEWEENTFNIVCFFDVLEHVDDPAKCIFEAARVLEKGGLFHAYIPVEGEMLTLHGLFNRLGVNLKEKTAGHIQKLTKGQILEMCDKSGLVVRECIWSCHLLNQIGDLAYYFILTITGRRLNLSLEEKINKEGFSVIGVIGKLLKNLISCIWYWESRIFWFIPGAGIHITCIKKV
ncbi:MAG: class I SAM-dependent methyltransferase [bacterium]|nr:class I SAM-dependent methyltransferase [bacterium]